MRRGLLIRMVLGEALALPQCRSGNVQQRLFMGRARRLGAVRARRRRRPATGQTGGLRRGAQGALLRRLGRPSGQGVLDRARPAPRRPQGPSLRKSLRRHRAGRVSLLRLGDATGACRWDSDRDRRIRRSLRRDRLRRARGHARQGDRHFDLRLRRRFGRKADRRYSRHLRHRERRHPAGLLRHRGRTVGRRRHFQMVGRGASSAATRRFTPS